MYTVTLRENCNSGEIINLLNLFKIRDTRFSMEPSLSSLTNDSEYLEWSLRNNYIEISIFENNEQQSKFKLYVSLDYPIIGLDKLYMNQNKTFAYHTNYKFNSIHTSPKDNTLYGLIYLSDKYFTRLYNCNTLFKMNRSGIYRLFDILSEKIDLDEYDVEKFYEEKVVCANLSSILKMGLLLKDSNKSIIHEANMKLEDIDKYAKNEYGIDNNLINVIKSTSYISDFNMDNVEL